MAGNTGHLAHLDPWYAEWLEPAAYQIYRGDLAGALHTVGLAREQFERETGLTEDERQILRYELEWTPFNYASFLGDSELIAQSYPQARAAIDTPPAGPLSAPTQAFYKISLAAKAVQLGLERPDPAQIRALVDVIPPSRFVIGTWAQVATVGFYMDAPDLIEEAFGELLTVTTGFRDSYSWLRVNLMYLISQGRAQFEDFRQLLASITHISELLSFRRDFTGHAARLGLQDEVDAVVNPLETRLRSKLEPPGFTPHTRRFRRDSN